MSPVPVPVLPTSPVPVPVLPTSPVPVPVLPIVRDWAWSRLPVASCTMSVPSVSSAAAASVATGSVVAAGSVVAPVALCARTANGAAATATATIRTWMVFMQAPP